MTIFSIFHQFLEGFWALGRNSQCSKKQARAMCVLDVVVIAFSENFLKTGFIFATFFPRLGVTHATVFVQF